MYLVGTWKDAHEKVLADTRRLVADIQRLSSQPITSISDGISVLRALREETYEDLNQIQHEHMILMALDWLILKKKFDNHTSPHPTCSA
jgi:hypothetical protein